MLRLGQLVAYPTEAVWGLGCDPFNAKAVYHLLALKNRPVEKGMILVAADWAQFSPFIEQKYIDVIQQKNEGNRPTSWVLPYKKGSLPDWIVGDHKTVAVRISSHKTVRSLCLAFNGPIVSTSANPSSCQAAREIFQLKRYFGLQLAICCGRIGHEQRPSQIIDGLTGTLLRG